MYAVHRNTFYLIHSGKGHDDNPPGRGSGRYAFGSGKRPFQGISEKDQKKAYKDLKKSHKNYASQPLRTTDEFKKKAVEHTARLITNEQLNKLNDLKSKMREKADFTDFYESKACEEASKRAYDKTYEWFEKNDPQYLKEIIDLNKGEKADLWNFHDFRKTLEGYEDIEWDKAQKEWNKSEEGKLNKKKEKEWDIVYSEYKKECENVAKDILGKYGNKKLADRDYTYNDLLSLNVDMNEVLKLKNK